ncbi:MAG: hypothetical protein RI952_523 [Bacteroidota bacterium]|jgi:hypothetical protein
MKKIALVFFLIFLSNGVLNAQVGIGTNSPSAKAALDVSSTSKGFLPPRLTYSEKNAITSPPAGLLLWCSNCGTNGELQVYNGTEWVNMTGGTASFALPALANTTAASTIAGTTATSGGSVSNDGGSTITARGVCWSTTTNPTIANSKTTESGTTGSFSSNLTGLSVSTTYYVRAYATNAIGTAYGTEVSFTTTSTLAVGDPYQGGVVAYILAAGDPGYNAGVQHGIVAAIADKTAAPWGCSGTSVSTTEAIGSGNSNTTAIITACSTAGIAAKVCADLVEGGYSDWFLPSRNELTKLYANKTSIGGFTNAIYLSSSHSNLTAAIVRNFTNGSETEQSKSTNYLFRPVHSF